MQLQLLLEFGWTSNPQRHQRKLNLSTLITCQNVLDWTTAEVFACYFHTTWSVMVSVFSDCWFLLSLQKALVGIKVWHFIHKGLQSFLLAVMFVSSCQEASIDENFSLLLGLFVEVLYLSVEVLCLFVLVVIFFCLFTSWTVMDTSRLH